ncbi:septum site-determining protein Ssd [Gordonia humi]|uniref:Secretion/DNA translocation related CpaE-like protein n=1 Tax=Gordonia humi TaxID=686429 RepID=A0A840ESV4_9ACTN|nr:septum site-determining protein Ssd [Gordonia humi]MBB4134772.1 secretion/DNA translocation related CpaE-like protein [Gordonia humi]
MTDVLLVLAAEPIHADLARCAAAAGYAMVVGDAASCRHDWLRATAVAVDAGAVDVLAALHPPRRGAVVVVGAREDDPRAWQTALSLGAQGGFVLPDEESGLVGALSEFRRPVRSPAGVVAVVGGHGGAGASSMTAAVALVASGAGQRVLLVDADRSGAGADLILGVEDEPGLRWPDVTGETGAIAGPALRAALPGTGRISVITSGRDDAEPLRPDTVLAVVDAGRSAGDVVVADVGREPGPVAAGLLDSADVAVLVTTASVHGVAASRRTAARLVGDREALLVVRGPSPGGLRARDVADAVGLPLLGGYRPERGLDRRCEATGLRLRRRGPLTRAAQDVYRRLRAGAPR